MKRRQSRELRSAVSSWILGVKTLVSLRGSLFPDALATHWPSFVDCPKRLLTEAPFLDRVLVLPSDGPVLDACAGIGCDSIHLRKRGFGVVSNEVDGGLRTIAQENAYIAGTQLSLMAIDWREIGSAFPAGHFQAILLLGNSLGLLQNERDIICSLTQMHSLLKPGGKLIIDQRNYDYILDHRIEILGGNFKYSQAYIYCGSKVQGRPIEIEDRQVKFGYFSDTGKLVGTLSMVPLPKQKFVSVLQRAGFMDIQPYYDFQAGAKDHYDFLTLVATRVAS
jgi:SAM-dependent methyltransferase